MHWPIDAPTKTAREREEERPQSNGARLFVRQEKLALTATGVVWKYWPGQRHALHRFILTLRSDQNKPKNGTHPRKHNGPGGTVRIGPCRRKSTLLPPLGSDSVPTGQGTWHSYLFLPRSRLLRACLQIVVRHPSALSRSVFIFSFHWLSHAACGHMLFL